MRTFSLKIVFLLASLGLTTPAYPRQTARAPIKAARSVATVEERKAFIEAMVNRGDPAIATTIARFIQDPDPGVATTACWALGELRNRETSSQATLALQQNSVVLVRATCATALGRIGDPQNVAPLNAAALNEKEDTDVRLASIQALAMFDTEQGSALVSLLENSDPRIRASAAYSACQLQLPAAVQAIKSMLRSDEVTKRYALYSAGIWPQAFSEDLKRIAGDPRESPENRVLSMTSLAGLSKEQRGADFVKSASELLEPDQPREVQVTAAQILSDVPEAQPVLNQIAKDRTRAPELLEKLNEIGFETAEPLTVATPSPAERDYGLGLEGLVGAVVGAALVLLTIYVRDRFREGKADRLRKEILLEMFHDESYPERWRTLDALMQVIGADRETTTRLLIEIGARASQEKGSNLWGLREKHPLGKEKDKQI